MDNSTIARGTLHEGGLEPAREILGIGIMTGSQRTLLDDNFHLPRETFLSDGGGKERFYFYPWLPLKKQNDESLRYICKSW